MAHLQLHRTGCPDKPSDLTRRRLTYCANDDEGVCSAAGTVYNERIGQFWRTIAFSHLVENLFASNNPKH